MHAGGTNRGCTPNPVSGHGNNRYYVLYDGGKCAEMDNDLDNHGCVLVLSGLADIKCRAADGLVQIDFSAASSLVTAPLVGITKIACGSCGNR